MTGPLAEDCTEAGLQRVPEEGPRKARRNDSRDDDSKKTSKSSAGAGSSAACCEVRGQGKSKSAIRGLRLLVCSNWGPGKGQMLAERDSAMGLVLNRAQGTSW